jgi:TRAP-type C4-dicarboxylate transport system permease small subunit
VRGPIDVLDRIAGAVTLVSACAGIAIMVSINLLILTEIVLRSFFGTSTQIVEEYVGYGLGAMIFLGLGQALRKGALVRVDLVVGRLGAMARRRVEIVLCLVTMAAMGFVMHFLFVSVQRNFERGTISMTRAATPIWIPEAIILSGMAIFSLALAVYLLKLIAGAPPVEESGRVE